MKHRRFLLTGLVLLLVSASSGGLGQAATPNAVIFPPGSHPYGMTYGQWSGSWWQWAVRGNTPETNAVLDTTGAHCAVGQSGQVWFLAGTFGNPTSVIRNCTIPAGKALFFPVVNAFCANNPGESATYNDELACARGAMVGAMGAAEIDGTDVRPVNHLEQRYRFSSPSFSLTLQSDNAFGAPAGTYAPAAADGIYLMLAPLSAGQHTIHFKGFAAGSDPPTSTVSLKVTYHLSVAR